MEDVALFRHVPTLRRTVPWVRLGDWPTPVEPLRLAGGPAGVDLWVKREDRSNARYGGNKIRTLEAWLGLARAAGAQRIWATGAYGSNHALATAVHASAAGLAAGAILFPQPASVTARANLSALIAAGPEVVQLDSLSALPFAMRRVARAERRAGTSAVMMEPGGARPEGAFGALSAAFELADQVATGVCPAPAHIVLAVGSNCTTAGLLAGLHAAAALGVGFRRPPAVTAVRVTPWPVTSANRIAWLAYRTLARFDALRGHDTGASYRALRASLEVTGDFIGKGYGHATARGLRAAARFAAAGGPPLDLVYSAKSGAAFLDLAARGSAGPLLFWATKSSAPLAAAGPEQLEAMPPALRRWYRGGHETGQPTRRRYGAL